jgi:hypothetical protein
MTFEHLAASDEKSEKKESSLTFCSIVTCRLIIKNVAIKFA